MINIYSKSNICKKCNGSGKLSVHEESPVLKGYVLDSTKTCPDCYGTGISTNSASLNKVDLITKKIMRFKEKMFSIIIVKLLCYAIIIVATLYLIKLSFVLYPVVSMIIYILILILAIVISFINA